MEYLARIEIDVEANGPREAANEAYDLLRHPDALPWVVDIYRKGVRVTRVDLSQENDPNWKHLPDEDRPDPGDNNRIVDDVASNTTSPLIYLASPFSDPIKQVRNSRFLTACTVTGMLLRLGNLVFSPIAHNVTVAMQHRMPFGWDAWSGIDLAVLGRCDELWVLEIDGWKESTGVQAEIAHMRQLGRPIKYVTVIHDSITIHDNPVT